MLNELKKSNSFLILMPNIVKRLITNVLGRNVS